MEALNCRVAREACILAAAALMLRVDAIPSVFEGDGRARLALPPVRNA